MRIAPGPSPAAPPELAPRRGAQFAEPDTERGLVVYTTLRTVFSFWFRQPALRALATRFVGSMRSLPTARTARGIIIVPRMQNADSQHTGYLHVNASDAPSKAAPQRLPVNQNRSRKPEHAHLFAMMAVGCGRAEIGASKYGRRFRGCLAPHSRTVIILDCVSRYLSSAAFSSFRGRALSCLVTIDTL